jgi:hypothetical protein
MNDRWGPPFLQVREVLLEEWDPIHVIANDGFLDEYDPYIPTLLTKLESGADAENIAQHLDFILTEIMGLWPRPEKAMAAAIALVELAQKNYR